MEQKKIVNKVVNFYNWTDEDFSHTYGGDQLDFPRGELTPIVVSDYKTNEGIRDLMAYHLAVRECNKMNFTPASKEDKTLLELIQKAKATPAQEVIPQKPEVTEAQTEAPKPEDENKESGFEGK